MESDDIKIILGLPYIPSVKITMISILISNKPLTVNELNGLLNVSKSFQNYEFMFRDAIDDGVIKIVSMKSKYSVKRKHFELSLDVLRKFEEE